LLLFLLSTLNDEEKTKLEKLYNHYKNLMMYIALDILKSRELAEEVVHDAMIALLKVINDIEEINSHKTYGLVVLIVKRLSINKQKYEKRRNHLSADVLEYTADEEVSVEESAICNADIEDLTNRMNELGIHDYEIIMLKYYYGYTYKEIADRMGTSETAARKRSERARKSILNKMKKREDER